MRNAEREGSRVGSRFRPRRQPKGSHLSDDSIAFLRQKCSVIAPFWSSILDLSIKSVPEDQVRRLRERAKANHRSLQGELRALIDEATGTPRRLGIDEIVARVRGLNLTRQDEAARLIREDRDR